MNTTNNELELQARARKRFALGSFLSAAGSLASLIALVIVFIDKAASSVQVDPQLIPWRIALAVLCLLAIGAIIMIGYELISKALSNGVISNQSKTLRVFVTASLAILGTAIFLDGVFAAFYWRWWLGGIFRNLKYMLGR
jgi:hypothetical protein